MKGANHWRIPEVVSYVPKSDASKCPDIKIKKNIYGQAIQGRKERVVTQLIQLDIKERYERDEIPHNLRWLEIVNTIERIKSRLWKWKMREYSTELPEED